ncbi:MAG: hypothetical protein GOU99_02710, partial [Candidatus Altiarchaeota archaeon]|nr:hypothetical protein [Candidatus Altiarchaeota archaeon]
GTGIKRLTTTTGWQSDHDPSWSPDSNSLAFMRFEGHIPWINIANLSFVLDNVSAVLPWNSYTISLDGQLTQLTNTSVIASLPVYSANGELIMFIDHELIFARQKLIGMYHRPTSVDLTGSNKSIELADTKHSYSLEYYDW